MPMWDFPELKTRVWGFSYYSREISSPLYDEIKVPKDSPMPWNILLAHGGDEKHIPMSADTFRRSGFDYIALGHIHKPQILEENYLAYPGSLEPLDKNETGHHGFIKGECSKDGTRIAFVPYSVREYKRFKLQVTERTTQVALENGIERILEEHGRHHIYTIFLEGIRGKHTEFLPESLKRLGNLVSLEDHTHRAYSISQLLEEYEGSVLEEYIRSFDIEHLTEEEEKILRLGIEALLESGEELL